MLWLKRNCPVTHLLEWSIQDGNILTYPSTCHDCHGIDIILFPSRGLWNSEAPNKKKREGDDAVITSRVLLHGTGVDQRRLESEMESQWTAGPCWSKGLWSYGLCIIVRNIKEYNFLKTHIWRPRARSMCLVTLVNRCIKGMHTQSYHVVVTRTSINQSYMFKYSHVNCQLYIYKEDHWLRFWEAIFNGSPLFKRISFARDVCRCTSEGVPPKSFLSKHQLARYISTTYPKNTEAIAEKFWNQLLLESVLSGS